VAGEKNTPPSTDVGCCFAHFHLNTGTMNGYNGAKTNKHVHK